MGYTLLIHPELFITALHKVAANSDYPLDEIFLWILGIFKHNDVGSLGCFKGYDGFTPVRNFNTVKEFIYQDVIADLQGLFHGTRGYFKSLNHKCPDEQGDQNCDQDSFNIFPPMTSPGLSFLFLRRFFFFQIFRYLS